MTDPNNDLDSAAHEPQNLDDDWAAAMAEQLGDDSAASNTKSSSTQADGLAAQHLDDDWASALAEQTAGGESPSSVSADASSAEPATSVFQPLASGSAGGNSDIDMIMDIPVQLSVELGRTRLTIKNILQLGQGSVVELDGLAGEPMDIFVNGYLIAQGEVVVVDEKYGIRVTDIITPSDRIQRLNGRR